MRESWEKKGRVRQEPGQEWRTLGDAMMLTRSWGDRVRSRVVHKRFVYANTMNTSHLAMTKRPVLTRVSVDEAVHSHHMQLFCKWAPIWIWPPPVPIP